MAFRRAIYGPHPKFGARMSEPALSKGVQHVPRSKPVAGIATPPRGGVPDIFHPELAGHDSSRAGLVSEDDAGENRSPLYARSIGFARLPADAFLARDVFWDRLDQPAALAGSIQARLKRDGEEAALVRPDCPSLAPSGQTNARVFPNPPSLARLPKRTWIPRTVLSQQCAPIPWPVRRAHSQPNPTQPNTPCRRGLTAQERCRLQPPGAPVPH